MEKKKKEKTKQKIKNKKKKEKKIFNVAWFVVPNFNFIYLYNVVAKNVFNSILNKDPYL